MLLEFHLGTVQLGGVGGGGEGGGHFLLLGQY